MEISYAGSIAHIAKINGESRVQPVSVHCRNTANYARQSAQCIGLGETAYLAGLLHDMGKCKSEFREYIINSSGGESVRLGTVNHTFAGVIFLFERYHSGDVLRQLTCEILSFAIASHHGLIDGVSPEFDNGFLHRLEKDRSEIHYEESRDNFLKECAESDELDNLFDKACNEVTLLYNAATSYIANSSDIGKSFKGKTRCFFVGMMARLVLSSVIDGDRRDTAEFDEGKLHKFIVADKQFWQERFDHFENKYKNDVLETAPDTLINRVRSYISDTAVKFAEKSGSSGIYRLTVGTGSGKTLSSLRFSLKCAQTHNKKRIIFVIPLLSILEQNAAEIKRFIDRSDIVLEHHSNVIKEGFADDAEQLNSYELLAESWDSPIIITTLVQLLNALFSGKTTAVRRLQALCNSVIVIDEVQSVPRKLMYIFNLAVDYLAKFCGCTILLSSATQPCFEKMEYPIILSENESIVEETEEMRKAFKRTEIIDKVDKYGMSIEELVDFARDVISDCSSLLVICNKKSTAQELFSQLSFAKNDNFNLYHLSTSMCMQHRRDTLDNIKSDLAAKDGRKTLCVSTQLVEAGVDFSFESCIRLEAGLDNIAQAAGRCNRNGEFGKICNVYVITLRR
ncbi:MAG: CRISPR-associated helicase Cas3', partial [Ruminococcus sp.]|nr:CRISPR-associated helicase Cas3' [Ruminococcus sp.]